MAEAPSYLIGRIAPPSTDGPGECLTDGTWCGHGEPLYAVFELSSAGAESFAVRLPAPSDKDMLRPNLVEVAPSDGSASFLIYDPRRHPASLFASKRFAEVEPRYSEPLKCEQCQGTRFRLAVGFEVPSDSTSPNDTSRFALASKCEQCGAAGIIYEDETA
jgi:hypothetical protein